MAFLRVKHIKGGDYLYLVENHRNGKEVYQDTVRYLGRIGGTSKAKGLYNTIHRIYHNEKAPSPEEVSLALQKGLFWGEMVLLLSLPNKRSVKIKVLSQFSTAENWDSKQRDVFSGR